MSRWRRRPRRLGRAALATGWVLIWVALPATALAHVDVDVGDGRYVMEIGFRDEPAYVGLPNALYVKVEEYATGGTQPVDGLAATLTADVSKDGQTRELALVPLGEGEYQGVFVPTALGDYTFRVAGTIGEATVDETVTSGPSTFNSVEPLSAIEFPGARSDAAQVQAMAATAQAEAATARMLAIAGVVVGLLGLVAGAVALTRARRVETVPAEGGVEATTFEPGGKLIR